MSTGQGTAGQLKITDTGKLDASGHPLVTEYVRQGGQVYTSSYYANSDGSVAVGAAGVGSPIPAPTPARARRATSRPPRSLVWEDGQDLSTTTTSLYQASSWAGLINLGASDLVSSTTQAGDPEPLLAGEYVQSLPGVTPGTGPDSADYDYSFQQIDDTDTPPDTQTSSWQDSTWYGTTTYYEKQVITTPKKNINTHSIRADRPININFIGLDEGDPDQQVSVEHAGGPGRRRLDRERRGGHQPPVRRRRPRAGGRPVRRRREEHHLQAATGIGADDPLDLALTAGATPSSPNPGTVNATTTSGDINLDDISGSMTIGQIATAPANGNVTLTADLSLFAADANSLVLGGAVTLKANFGSIGTLGTNGTANSPAADALPITVHVGSANLDKLNVDGPGRRLRPAVEPAGDLRLNKITSTGGNVRVEVKNGTSSTPTTSPSPTPRTSPSSRISGTGCSATPDTAQVSINATVAAYQNQVDQSYRQYWQYRDQQAAAETVGGLVHGATYWVVVDPADPTRIYLAASQADAQAATGARQSFDAPAVDASSHLVNLPGNAFSTGQAVAYHQGSGSIAGLSDGAIYFLWVDPTDPSRVGLAASPGQAKAASPDLIPIGAASGTGFILVDAHLINLTPAAPRARGGSPPPAAPARSRSTPRRPSPGPATRSSSSPGTA